MDLLSIIGLLLALVAIIVGAILKGAGIHALLSAAAFMIVVVGTVAAVLVQTPGTALRRAFAMLPWIFRPPAHAPEAKISRIVDWANVARRQGVLGLEPAMAREADAFMRKGLQMVIDGSDPDGIRSALEVELLARESADMRASRVFESMGIYSPTLGIIGAVLGLMAVMQNLADPARLGAGIAAAFVATVYGIGLANLFFLPIANKLKAAVQTRAHVHEMIIEGMCALAQGENPRVIETLLRGYLH